MLPADNYTPIYTLADLQGVLNDLGGKFRLMNDINLNGASSPLREAAFYGVFDGNGFSLKNITMTETLSEYDTDQYFGGFVGQNSGTIKNVGIKNLTINITALNSLTIGGLCGNNFGLVVGCYTDGNINVSANISTLNKTFQGGGFIGVNHGSIRNSYTAVNISIVRNYDSRSFVGGFCNCYSGNISNCFATGNVSSSISVGYTYVDAYTKIAPFSTDFNGTVATNIYYLSTQTLTIVNDGHSAITYRGTSATIDNLKDETFLINSVGFEKYTNDFEFEDAYEKCWKFGNFFPKLKGDNSEDFTAVWDAATINDTSYMTGIDGEGNTVYIHNVTTTKNVSGLAYATVEISGITLTASLQTIHTVNGDETTIYKAKYSSNILTLQTECSTSTSGPAARIFISAYSCAATGLY